MQALRLVMLVVVLAFAYLLFLRPQTNPESLTPDLAAPNSAASSGRAHSQYKEDMDRAQAVAKQMQAQRVEADAVR